MRNIILAGAAALAFTAAPAIAQDMDREAYDMTTAQQQMFMNWEDDQRIAYERWPADIQEYYWTLDDNQTRAWWVLNDDQRVRLFEMTPQQRSTAWTQIAAQMNQTNMPATATARTTTTSTANMRFVRNEMVQATPGDQGPPTGDLPLCEPQSQDNCINPWEAGKRGASVPKPLDYWPGQPASEMN